MGGEAVFCIDNETVRGDSQCFVGFHGLFFSIFHCQIGLELFVKSHGLVGSETWVLLKHLFAGERGELREREALDPSNFHLLLV